MADEPRTAIITGASAGLGVAIALEIAALGWKVAVGARRVERVEKTAEQLRKRGATAVYAGALDVTDESSIERFFESSERELGPANVIVNNAGASRFQPVESTDARALRAEIETNLIGPMLVTQRALKPLLAEGRRGDVVMMSSDAAKHPRPGQLAYGASKAGLEAYAAALSLSLEGTGIRVTTIRLGPAVSEFSSSLDMTPDAFRARTDYWAGYGLRDARMMKNSALGVLRPDDVGRAVVHAVTLPPHVLVETLELQPAYPRKRR